MVNPIRALLKGVAETTLIVLFGISICIGVVYILEPDAFDFDNVKKVRFNTYTTLDNNPSYGYDVEEMIKYSTCIHKNVMLFNSYGERPSKETLTMLCGEVHNAYSK